MSDIQEGLSIILDELREDKRYIPCRLEAAIDVMEVVPYYDHLKILKAIFHVPEPTPEESGEQDGA